jgi:replication factor A1
VKKPPLISYKNQKGSGQILNIDLIDREGTMIQATMFNETAERWDSKLEENKVYIFANGKVNLANKRFTSIKNDYSLTFDNKTEI